MFNHKVKNDKNNEIVTKKTLFQRSKYWFSAILSYLQNLEKGVYCFPLILRIKYSLQICCYSTVCFKIRAIKFKFGCNSMISQSLANCKSQFSKKEEVGSYDNIALNQRNRLWFTVRAF